MKTCTCENFKELNDIETGVWMFASIHNYFYPVGAPIWQFCPACGKELIES